MFDFFLVFIEVHVQLFWIFHFGIFVTYKLLILNNFLIGIYINYVTNYQNIMGIYLYYKNSKIWQ
jgi:hypothetical protein